MRPCGGVQRFCFNPGLEFFKYVVLVAGNKPLQKDASKTYVKDLAVIGGKEGTEFPSVDFDCLKGQYPVTPKRIDILRGTTSI